VKYRKGALFITRSQNTEFIHIERDGVNLIFALSDDKPGENVLVDVYVDASVERAADAHAAA
jgi:hypothetical protein